MTEILNAWGDPLSGFITTYQRLETGQVIRRQVRGEFASYLAKRDCTRELLRTLRMSTHVAGVTQEGDWVRIVWRSMQAREAACDPKTGWFATQKIPTYEADVPLVRRWMADNDVKLQRPRRVYLDIETCGRVAIAQKEDSRIICWTLAVEGDEHQAHVVAQGMLQRDDDLDEARVLRELFAALQAYDQVLAWNGDNFDFPVIFARAKKHGIRFDRMRWIWLDQLELFRRMNMSASESGDEKQSFALGKVSMTVLQVGKLEGVTYRDIFPFWEAGGEKRQRVLDYNAQDTTLMPRIESKTGYVELLQTICEVCGVIPDTYGVQPMPQVETFLFKLGRERGMHFRTRGARVFGATDGEGSFSGAYVMEPKLRGIGRDVHVADFAAMYPSIIRSFNMSPDTRATAVVDDDDAFFADLAKSEPSYLGGKRVDPSATSRPDGCARAPGTGHLFLQEPIGLLPLAIEKMLDLRAYWSAKQASLPPGTPEWVEAGRRSSAYKIAANSFFGVAGAHVSRVYDRAVASSITSAGEWLLRETIAAAEKRGFEVVYADTDSIFVRGCTAEQFREFVAWCNAELYPELLRSQGCARNFVKLAYEKQFDRIIFNSAKHYIGRFAHYKGKAATADSKPEIKGLEYKRGDAMRLARRLQAEVVDLLLGGGVELPSAFGMPVTRRPRVETCEDDPQVFAALIESFRDQVLRDPLVLEDVVLSKRLSKPLKEYKTKTKKDGTDGAAPPHVRVAKVLAERGEDVRPGTRIEYFIVDGLSTPATVLPVGDWTGELDRYELWEGSVWPPTARLLAAAFPAESWSRFNRVRPRALKRGVPVLTPAQDGVSPPAPSGGRRKGSRPSLGAAEGQGALFTLTELGPTPLIPR